jgi:hypothetical protein
MPTVSLKETVQINASATVIYDLITEHVSLTVDQPEAVVKQRPLDEGPVRAGFRYETTVVHNRHLCGSKWTVTRAERPYVLEQTMVHTCAEASKTITGGDRWELNEEPTGASTLVTLISWKTRPGLDGLIKKLFGDRSVSRTNLKVRLNSAQFESERRFNAR